METDNNTETVNVKQPKAVYGPSMKGDKGVGAFGYEYSPKLHIFTYDKLCNNECVL